MSFAFISILVYLSVISCWSPWHRKFASEVQLCAVTGTCIKEGPA